MLLLSADNSISENLTRLNSLYKKASSFDDINTDTFKAILQQTITLALLGKEQIIDANILTSQILASSKNLRVFLDLKNAKEVKNFLRNF